jgi:hypothetical protein
MEVTIILACYGMAIITTVKGFYELTTNVIKLLVKIDHL